MSGLRRSFLVAVLLVPFLPTGASGGNDRSVKLAMHLVASEAYLDCEVLITAVCESISVDFSGAELKGKCGGEEREGVQDSVIVETGVLYVYGNRLVPPYTFAFIGDELYVNGLRLYPKLPRQRGVPTKIPVHIQQWIDVDKKAAAITRDLLGQQVPYDSCISEAVKIYEASSVVDSVKIVSRNIGVWWAGESAPYWIMPPGPPPRRHPTREEVCMEIAQEMKAALKPGRVVFYGNGATVVMSETQAAADLELLHEARNPYAEGLLLLGGETARDLLDPISLELLERDL